MLRTKACPILLIAVSVFAAVYASPPKVEFVSVEGERCLRPKLLAADATLEDFRDAERRWLAEHHPDAKRTRVETTLRLAPEETADDEEYVSSETVFLERMDGTALEVCFEIGLKWKRT